MHYVEGSRYVGTFVKDQRNGYGMYVFADGERYQGMWKNNQRHGYGTFQYNEGTIFEGTHTVLAEAEAVKPSVVLWLRVLHLLSSPGTWYQDLRKGEGRLCMANGDVVSGVWQGEQISQATFTKGSPAQANKYATLPSHSAMLLGPSDAGERPSLDQIFAAAVEQHAQDGQEAGPRRSRRLRSEVEGLLL
jgi:hypothetical protein